MPNFIEIEETFCGRTDVRTFESGFIRPSLKSWPNKFKHFAWTLLNLKAVYESCVYVKAASKYQNCHEWLRVHEKACGRVCMQPTTCHEHSPPEHIISSSSSSSSLAAWRSGNGVGRINEVTLCRARLVLGWVTNTRVRLPEAALYFGM